MNRPVHCYVLCSAFLLLSTTQPLLASPVQESVGKVAVLHGGVGEEDRAEMLRAAKDHNLRLTFARKGSGAYLSDVRVVIRDRAGATVLETLASGPWLFARLPAGEYVVAASMEGITLTQPIGIKGAARQDWVFRFDAPAGAAPELNPR